MSDSRPGSRLVVDVLGYVLARLLLVVVLTAVIFGAGHLLGLRDFPLVVALLFALVIALPLGIWIFAPLRRRATASIAAFDERRRKDREQLQARLRGEEPPDTMTAVLAREAFGAEFVGADGFLNSPTYGLPPRFMVDALQDCIARWQAGTMEVPLFDEDVRAGRAGYAALTGVPVDSVAMGGTVSALLGLVAAAVPDGSRVATLAGEFTSTTFPFAAQAGRGVTLTELTADELVSAAADFDVVTVSLVQSANGAVLDTERFARDRDGHRHADRHRHHPGPRLETRRRGLGRRYRRGGLQVAAGASRHGVDVVERQGESHHDPTCCELVCGGGPVADDLWPAAAAGRQCAALRRLADLVQRAGRRPDAAVAGLAGPCRR